MPITLIVAVSQNNVIGKNDALPWHLPRDLAYFKAVTTACPIIMGRKTYESIGKALPERFNIVISRRADYELGDAEVVSSLSTAIDLAKKQIVDGGEIHIIGGAGLFKAALPIVDKIYLNRVMANIAGDVFLPDIKWHDWQLVSQTYHQADAKNAYALRFEVYQHR